MLLDELLASGLVRFTSRVEPVHLLESLQCTSQLLRTIGVAGVEPEILQARPDARLRLDGVEVAREEVDLHVVDLEPGLARVRRQVDGHHAVAVGRAFQDLADQMDLVRSRLERLALLVVDLDGDLLRGPLGDELVRRARRHLGRLAPAVGKEDALAGEKLVGVALGLPKRLVLGQLEDRLPIGEPVVVGDLAHPLAGLDGVPRHRFAQRKGRTAGPRSSSYTTSSGWTPGRSARSAKRACRASRSSLQVGVAEPGGTYCNFPACVTSRCI